MFDIYLRLSRVNKTKTFCGEKDIYFCCVVLLFFLLHLSSFGCLSCQYALVNKSTLYLL